MNRQDMEHLVANHGDPDNLVLLSRRDFNRLCKLAEDYGYPAYALAPPVVATPVRLVADTSPLHPYRVEIDR